MAHIFQPARRALLRQSMERSQRDMRNAFAKSLIFGVRRSRTVAEPQGVALHLRVMQLTLAIKNYTVSSLYVNFMPNRDDIGERWNSALHRLVELLYVSRSQGYPVVIDFMWPILERNLLGNSSLHLLPSPVPEIAESITVNSSLQLLTRCLLFPLAKRAPCLLQPIKRSLPEFTSGRTPWNLNGIFLEKTHR